MKNHSIEPHDLIEVAGHTKIHFYRVYGVYIGGLGTISTVTLGLVNEEAAFASSGAVPFIVPLMLLDQGLTAGVLKIYKHGDHLLNSVATAPESPEDDIFA